MKKILVTGMSGLIGGILKRHLNCEGGYELSALNRTAIPGVKCTQADISDLEAIKPAFLGVHTVVHLAAFIQDPNDWQGNLSANIIGTYNVYEAARSAGVKRVVFASSGSTVSGFETMAPYDGIVEGRYSDVPKQFKKITHKDVWPRGVYGASKVWGEAIGRHFADEYQISILCVRIGRVTSENLPVDSHHASRFLSHRDVAQILHKCIDAPDHIKFDVFMALSDNKWGYRDLDHSKEVLGYNPEDTAEDVLL